MAWFNACGSLVTFIYAIGVEQPATSVEMGWDRSGGEPWPEHYRGNLVTINISGLRPTLSLLGLNNPPHTWRWVGTGRGANPGQSTIGAIW